ncbi:hypothetical protein NDU88_005276 [Pleurodeles waltl]|uniref:Uncharacterized protein n=1 Tax=Pleurodeles waltl TaxID=8319 RepID=A0AAV7LP31_PLEWA|nr:hypothetical protein NDU88_005276 [Pleurodeles waltl]
MQSSPPPSPERRLTETRGGSSTPPGLRASNSFSALLDPGTYGPKQRGATPGLKGLEIRRGFPRKRSPPSGRTRDKGLYLNHSPMINCDWCLPRPDGWRLRASVGSRQNPG